MKPIESGQINHKKNANKNRENKFTCCPNEIHQLYNKNLKITDLSFMIM